MNTYSREQLAEVADLCRAAHDNILTYGWKRGGTSVEGLDRRLCLGSALAMAEGSHSWGFWNWDRYAGEPHSLCGNGRIFREYAMPIIRESGFDFAGWYAPANWNDFQRDEGPVLDLLVNVEKAIRDDLGQAAA